MEEGATHTGGGLDLDAVEEKGSFWGSNFFRRFATNMQETPSSGFSSVFFSMVFWGGVLQPLQGMKFGQPNETGPEQRISNKGVKPPKMAFEVLWKFHLKNLVKNSIHI